MKIKRKMLGLVLLSIISFGVVGCSNSSNNSTNQNQEASTDEVFISDFEKAINKRWDEQNKLEKKFATNTSYTDKQYTEDTIKVLENEVATLEKNKEGIKDKDLKQIAKDYIEGVRQQIEAQKTNDYELQSKYQETSDKLRKPALIAMVDDYGIKIKDEHEQTYKDFKEQATIINKENESQAFADKLASEMTFEKKTDEFGYVEFTTIVENTSDIDFKNLSYKVQYKDKDGVVVGDDLIYLENFDAKSKQKVKLTPFEEDIENIIVTTDWFESK